MLVQPFFTGATMVLMICAMILFEINAATELDSVNLKENFGRNLAELVRTRLRPGLTGTPLAENNVILHILAAYLCSPYMPTQPLFQLTSGHVSSIDYVQVSEDTRTAVTMKNFCCIDIRTWDLYTGACTHIIPTDKESLSYRAYATTKYVIFDSHNLMFNNMGHLTGETHQVWDLLTRTRVAIQSTSENIIINRIISDDEKVAMIISSRRVYLWYWDSNHQAELLNIENSCQQLVSSDNKVLVILFLSHLDAETYTLNIYRMTENHSIICTHTLSMNAYLGLCEKIFTQQTMIGLITNVYNPLTFRQHTIHLWDWENNITLDLCNNGEMSGCAFSTDGTFMAIVRWNKVTLWSVATGTRLIKLYVNIADAGECMFYGNNTVLMVTGRCGGEPVCTLDVSYLYYNDSLTMKYQYFRTLIERGYMRIYFQELKKIYQEHFSACLQKPIKENKYIGSFIE